MGLAVAVLALVAAGPAVAADGGGGLGAAPGGGGHPHPAPARHQQPRPAPSAARTLVIRGGGDGHGVGMSQYGAEGYALHGFTDGQILAHYYPGTAIASASATQTVRVLLGDGRALFSGASAAGGTRLDPGHTYSVVATGLGDAVAVVAASGRRVATARGPLTVVGPGPLVTAGGRYRGTLQFSADGSGGVDTVNDVALDDYVQGVIAAEMPSSWAPAALEAQAIAARTYALTTTVHGAGFDLYDDTRSQMYGGVDAETAPTDAAAAATAGQIVTDAGRPAVTYFFASSGGHTESVQNVWPGSPADPWLQGVSDPYDGAADDPYQSWTVTLSLAAATTKLGALVHGTLRGIVITRHGVSPRVMTAEVKGTRGTTTVTGAQLQQAFGLLSTDATFTVG